jgi:hypothetical protein
MSYDLPAAQNRVSHPPLRLVRSEPVPLSEALVDAPAAPQPFWPRLSRAVTLLGIGALAHTLLPTDARLPRMSVVPPPTAQAAESPAGDAPHVHVDRLTIVAPVAPPVPQPQPPGDRKAQVTPSVPAAPALPIAVVRASHLELPSAVGTTGAMPAPPSFDVSSGPRSDPPSRRLDSAAGKTTPAETVALRAALSESPGGGDGSVASSAIAHGKRAAAEVAERTHEPAARPVSASHVNDEDLVRRLLDEFTGAFERLDVSATKAVWPSVDDRKLRRAYEQLSAQRLSLESCGITISGQTANARCQGSATYQPKIGNRAVEIASREWMFDLSKQDAAWRIVNTVVR